MAIDFPDSPALNDSFTSGGKKWIFNGTTWNLITANSYTIPTGEVTTAKILDANVTAAKLASGAAVSNIGYTPANIASPTFTGTVTLAADPASALQAATKQYVDNVSAGIVAKPSVLGATVSNVTGTYYNGPNDDGVGATLTHDSNGVFPSGAGGASGWGVGKGILLKNQTNKEENGRYFVSNMGSVSTPYVLTRCVYCDEASEIPGAYIFVQDGTYAGTGWIQIVADPSTFVVGTDDIDVFQFSGAGTYVPAATTSTGTSGFGYMGLPQNGATTGAYGIVAADAGTHIYSTATRTITIPANETIAMPVGSTVVFIAGSGATVTIAITTDTMYLAGAGTTGSRTLAAFGMATAVKITSTSWMISGNGLT